MKTILLAVMAMITCSLANSQTWQWGQRGGGSGDPQSGVNMYNREDVYDIATDRNGNVYTLAMVTGGGVTVGSSYVTTYGGPYQSANLLITSHSCNGTLRWVKAIGGENGNTAIAIRTDTFGHVYVMGGAFGQYPINISGDTTIAASYRRLFIVQYDTSGNFKWVRMPDPDTLTVYTRTQGFDMEVDGAGNLNAIVWLNKGSLNYTSYLINSPGLYVLKYNAQGSVVAATKPPGFDFAATTAINYPNYIGYAYAAFNSFRMARMPNGNWILAGEQYRPVFPGFSINGRIVDRPLFVACFNSAWQYQWHYISDTTFNGISGRPAIDNSNAIYLAGYAYYHTHLFGMTIPAISGGTMPFTAKLNSSGSAQWLTFASDNKAVDGCSAATRASAITLNTSGDVIVTGGCGGLTWGSKRIPGICNTGYTAFIGRFNAATGTCVALDTIPKQGGGGGNFGTAIAAGKNNTVYVGGNTQGNQIAGHDTMIFAGGTSDFFVARFGVSCNCFAAPISNFSSSIATGKTLKFTYTGTTSNIDSVVWIWGDGQQLTLKSGYTTPLSHTYTGGGSYTACANVYGSCGSSSYCKQTALGLGGISAFNGVSIYPNPAATYFTVEGASGATVTLSNAVGQVAKSFRLTTDKEVLDISGLAAGVYVLQLRDKEGNRGMMKMVKE